MALILLQLLLRQSEGCVTHQRRYGNLDPFWSRALSMRATTLAGPTPMPFAAARTLDDLRPLVFRDHALELHHQLIFRRGAGRSLEKNQFDALTVELLRQQNLIRVLPAETIRRVHQHRLDVSLRH